jgi:hypothetical protein
VPLTAPEIPQENIKPVDDPNYGYGQKAHLAGIQGRTTGK